MPEAPTAIGGDEWRKAFFVKKEEILMSEKKETSIQIQIRADDSTQAGAFSNFARIMHSREEFTLDFMVIHHSPPFGKLQSRVIVTPAHAKRFLKALEENIRKYEEAHGEISAAPFPPEDFGFTN
jgi:hypothetical protein